MRYKNIKRYLTVDRSEINKYISLVMTARNIYIDENKPIEDVDALLFKLIKTKEKLRA